MPSCSYTAPAPTSSCVRCPSAPHPTCSLSFQHVSYPRTTHAHAHALTSSCVSCPSAHRLPALQHMSYPQPHAHAHAA